MKTKVFAVVVVVFLASGCATRQNASLKNGEHEIYNSNHTGIFPGPDDATSVANAEATIIAAKAQAALTEALAKQIEQGQTAATINGRYIGIIINDDSRLTAYVPHPEMSQKVKITPGSYAVLVTNRIADRITIYDALDNYTVVFTHKEGGIYNGIKYDYGVRIRKVR